MKRILLYVLLTIVLVIAGTAAYLRFVLPDVEAAPGITINATPAQIRHGAYLANNVAVCMDCHSTRDWTRFSAPPVAGTQGKGGEYFGQEMGFPGKYFSKNLTPAHLKDWTDGEIFRAVTSGVRRDGSALFPVMPYTYYRKMDKEDIYDIIAYIRSLQPVDNNVPESKSDFPVNFLINTMPGKPDFSVKPLKADTVKYGAYMANVAGCMECHTQQNHGKLLDDKAFAGGRDFKMPGGMLYSANITPDIETGIGNWNADAFVSRFKAYLLADNLSPLADGQVNTVMPWSMYAGMDTVDLRAIYTYLKTIKPIKNRVQHFVPSANM